MSLTITIRNRGTVKGPRFPLEMVLPDDSTLAVLKSSIAKMAPGMPSERQRITDENKRALEGDEKPLRELQVNTGDVLYVKDLGPQIGWRTVFLVEYAGPLIIHPLIYYAAPCVWKYFGRSFTVSHVQTLVFTLVMLHFAKRELESLFVHRFSHGTMPLFNIFKNSSHYWILSGVLLAVGLYSPFLGQQAVQGTLRDNCTFLAFWTAVWALAELANLYTHLILMSLRPKGTRVRRVPHGFAFEQVSCPNYFFEAVAWTSITAMTFSLSALVFTVVSSAQMTLWAVKKHKAYKREFKDEYPLSRRIMYPFIFSEEDLERHVAPVRAVLALRETEDSWQRIDKALAQFQLFAKGGATKLASYVSLVKELSPGIARSLLSERTKLSGTASDVINSIAPRLGERFAPLLPVFVPPLLQLCARTNKVAIKRAEKSLHLIFVALGSLVVLVDACDPDRFQKRVPDLERTVRQLATDPSAEFLFLALANIPAVPLRGRRFGADCDQCEAQCESP
ncbi:very-long-chain enoyl-CoA reductase [Malassezia sp. CBS 17886]|nr:very-long-chain enoyl-CoA reductase [Malassezia sp. CBS 17886]